MPQPAYAERAISLLLGALALVGLWMAGHSAAAPPADPFIANVSASGTGDTPAIIRLALRVEGLRQLADARTIPVPAVRVTLDAIDRLTTELERADQAGKLSAAERASLRKLTDDVQGLVDKLDARLAPPKRSP
jgi:hypothetical protein